VTVNAVDCTPDPEEFIDDGENPDSLARLCPDCYCPVEVHDSRGCRVSDPPGLDPEDSPDRCPCHRTYADLRRH